MITISLNQKDKNIQNNRPVLGNVRRQHNLKPNLSSFGIEWLSGRNSQKRYLRTSSSANIAKSDSEQDKHLVVIPVKNMLGCQPHLLNRWLDEMSESMRDTFTGLQRKSITLFDRTLQIRRHIRHSSGRESVCHCMKRQHYLVKPKKNWMKKQSNR